MVITAKKILQEITDNQENLSDSINVCLQVLIHIYDLYLKDKSHIINQHIYQFDVAKFIGHHQIKRTSYQQINDALVTFKNNSRLWHKKHAVITMILTQNQHLKSDKYKKFAINKFMLAIIALLRWHQAKSFGIKPKMIVYQIYIACNSLRLSVTSDNLKQQKYFPNYLEALSSRHQIKPGYYSYIDTHTNFNLVSDEEVFTLEDFLSTQDQEDSKKQETFFSRIPNSRRFHCAHLFAVFFRYHPPKIKPAPNHKNNKNHQKNDEINFEINAYNNQSIFQNNIQADISDDDAEYIDFVTKTELSPRERDNKNEMLIVDCNQLKVSHSTKSSSFRAYQHARAISNSYSKRNVLAAWHPTSPDRDLMAHFTHNLIQSIQHNESTGPLLVILLSLLLGRKVEDIVALICRKMITNKVLSSPSTSLKKYQYQLTIELNLPKHDINIHPSDLHPNKFQNTTDQLLIILAHNYQFPTDSNLNNIDETAFIDETKKCLNQLVTFQGKLFLKPAQIEKFLTHNLIQDDADMTTIRFLSGESPQKHPDMTYLCVSKKTLLSLLMRHIELLNSSMQNTNLPVRIGQRALDLKLITTAESNDYAGSKLNLSEATMATLLIEVFNKLEEFEVTSRYSTLVEQHNKYIFWFWTIFMFMTGARPSVHRITWDKFNLIRNTILISDKENRIGSAERIIAIPELLYHYIIIYEQRLIQIAKTHLNYPFQIARNANKLLNCIKDSQSIPVFFSLNDDLSMREMNSNELFAGVSEYLVERQNLARHFIKTLLTDRLQNKQITNNWLGHESMGLEANAEFSNISLSQIRQTAAMINEYFVDHITYQIK